MRQEEIQRFPLAFSGEAAVRGYLRLVETLRGRFFLEKP
jgi:hypothetical protein